MLIMSDCLLNASVLCLQIFKVLKTDNQDVLGDEIIFLTDGEATDTLSICVPAAINSGAIIHTIALGDKADKALREMADKTGE